MKRKAREQKAFILWSGADTDINSYFDKESNPNWQHAFAPLIEGVVKDSAGYWKVETPVAIGMAFDVHNLEAEDWFNTAALKFATPISQTSKDEIAGLLQQAEIEGWTITQMQVTMTDLFNQWIHGNTDAAGFAGQRLPPYRTEMIARTVSMQSYNAGSNELFRQAGVEEREWIATHDDRTRDTHLEADGQVMGSDEPFVVGGWEMMFPGDDSYGAPAEEIVNCRCTILPVIPEEGVSAPDEVADEGAAVGGEMSGVDESMAIVEEAAPSTPSPTYIPSNPADFGKLNDWPIDEVTKWTTEQEKWIKENVTALSQEGLKRYTGSSYELVNDKLRGVRQFEAGSWNATEAKKITGQMDRAMAKSSVDQAVTVYRGVDKKVFGEWNDIADDMLPGMVFTDQGFSSTSTDVKLLNSWGGRGKYEIEVLVPEGSRGIYVQSISHFPHERELILDRGSSFRVISAQNDTTKGIRHLVAELVQDE